MIRFLHAYFPARTVFLGVSEALLVTLSFTIATVGWLGTLDATIALNYERGFEKIAVVTAVFLLCMYYFDLYDPIVLTNRREIFTRMVQVLGTVCIILAGARMVFPGLELRLPIFLTGTALVGAFVLTWRRVFLLMNTSDLLAERCLVLGDGQLAETLIAELNARSELGLRVVARIGETEDADTTAGRLRDCIMQRQVTRVIVAMNERRGKLDVEELLRLKTEGLRIQDGTALYEAITGKINLASLRLSWLLFSPGFQVSRPLLIYKRIFSLVVSSIALLIALPVMVLVAIAIRLDSPGPIIFRQRRVGKNGRIFTLYKFRSMYDGADREGGCRPAEHGDPRCTRVGRYLRAWRLDELPQLYNIFRGDLYFVGPRPFVPEQEAECVRHIPFYKQRWTVKPGATGWAQVNRGYCATIDDNAEKLAYDLFYIKNISIGLDLLILFKSFKILLLGKGGR
ncbi:MAG: sugar transferase [Terriglobales bacterium]